MTNQDVINASKKFYGGSNCVSAEMWQFIKDNYRQVEKDYGEKNGGTWHKVYCQGCDCKYGTQMIEPTLMLRRQTTFDEFYGGGIVD